MRFSLLFGLMLTFTVQAGACGANRGAGAQNKEPAKVTPAATPATQTPTPIQKPTAGGTQETGSVEMKVLAEGRYGSVEEPFAAVVRDAETYASLRELANGLPELGADFFKANAVVAAFLGTRSTGGYSVAFESAGGDAWRVSEVAPQKGAMLTQALTQPFKVVSVPAGEGAPVRLELGQRWKSAARAFQVREGEFEQSGGIAGRAEAFKLKGVVQVMRLGKLVTLAFDLSSAGSARERALRTHATGALKDDGSLSVARLPSGTLVEQPNGGLRAAGRLADAEGKLSLTFEPLPVNISDSYQGRGRLEASATPQQQ